MTMMNILLRSSRTLAFVFALFTVAAQTAVAQDANDADDTSIVHCANLTYADGKTAKCFANAFLTEIGKRTHIKAAPEFSDVHLESADLFEHPFAVMSGAGSFTLTKAQRKNMRDYLTRGGFLVASPGCSDRAWGQSFKREIGQVFPSVKLRTLDMKHPVFQTVFKITKLVGKRAGSTPTLQGLELDGRIVLVYTDDGLNDTANAGGKCCCCGGNEIRNAKQVNVNLLAYALTH